MGRLYDWVDQGFKGILPGGPSPTQVFSTQYKSLDSMFGGFLPSGVPHFSYPGSESYAPNTSPSPTETVGNWWDGVASDSKKIGIGLLVGAAVLGVFILKWEVDD